MMLTDGVAVAWRLLQGGPDDDVWVAARNDAAAPGWAVCALSFSLNRGHLLPVLADVGTQGCLLAMLVEDHPFGVRVSIDGGVEAAIDDKFGDELSFHGGQNAGDALALALLEAWA